MKFLDITKLNLMLGGVKPTFVDNDKFWCGVDAGAKFLLAKGIKPLVVYGDFDSFSSAEFEKLNFRKKKSQDYTDTEFALLEILKDFPNICEINIYGATGKRLDHFYGNMILLNNDKFKDIQLNIIDEHNFITMLRSGEHTLHKKADYKYVSFVPIYPETNFTITGAEYSAENLELTVDRPNATSNEFLTDTITVKVTKNTLLIYSKD